MTLQLLLVDDHVLFAEALRELLALQPDMAVIGTAATAYDAVRAAIDTRPDVVVMDHYMPGMNGTEATRVIKERSPRTRVLMMSADAGPAQVLRALRAGASGFLAKWCRPDELYRAIREVHAGRRYVQRELADTMLGRLLDSAHEDDDPLERLSARERQVLQMIAEGRTAAAIADTLCLSVRTVETYRARLTKKLGFRDVPTLVKFAIRHHLIPLEDPHHE